MHDNPTKRPHDQKRQHHYQTAAETFDRIRRGTTPWVAIGDFLDDWRRAPAARRRPPPLGLPGCGILALRVKGAKG